ncbi:hypothetical protein GGR38_004676 [Novosphingobium sediminicola]|uniref:Uncharacterized protein n=1 Tax=Novosphingobium sediminicola TaxID=563162 RepID=A0A7W6G8V2_9SPHN|nr:hypothetical protein [Novosphingobium sediminicola]
MMGIKQTQLLTAVHYGKCVINVEHSPPVDR